MKKHLSLIALMLVFICLLASCGGVLNGGQGGNNNPPAHTHAFEEWEVTKNPACTKNGEKVRYCACGEKQTEIILATGHTEVVDAAVEATCTATGHTEGKHCSICNEIIVAQEIISAKPHTFGEWSTINKATCTVEGLQESTCACGEKESESIPATGHNYTEGVCEGCGDISSEPTADEYFIFTELEDGTYSVAAKDVTNMPKVVVIPAEYNGKAVTVIADGAFVLFPSDGNSEPVICTNMTNVVIPYSVTSIGMNAFAACANLTSVTFGDNSQLTSIGRGAFSSCQSLTSVEIPDSVTSIGDYAFVYCYKLVEVINKSSLDITVGSSDYGYVAATHVIEVHDGESKIVNKDKYLFYTYDGINYLVGYIGSDVALTLPENYNGEDYEIYEFSFYGCSSLTSIVIPDSVTTIGDYAFFSCPSLTDVYYTGTEEEWGAISIGSSNDYLTNATIHYNYVPEE